MTGTVQSDRVGQPVDAAEFGAIRCWVGAGREMKVYAIATSDAGHLVPGADPETGGWQLGVEWDHPRDIEHVHVRFASDADVPSDLAIQYWRQNWPTPAPERLPGARRGWIGRDDPWNGHWVSVRADIQREGSSIAFQFDPIDSPELESGLLDQMAGMPSVYRQSLRWLAGRLPEMLEEAEDYLAPFRRTLKIRLVGSGEPPEIAELRALTPSTWRQRDVEVWFEEPGDWSGTVGVDNGYIARLDGLGFAEGEAIAGRTGWCCRVDSAPKGIRLGLITAQCPRRSGDRSVVTLATNKRSFSFLTSDVEEGPVCIEDYGVVVKDRADSRGLAQKRASPAERPRSIYDRVAHEPEQSYERAAEEIPPLDPTKTSPFGRYLPLGVEAGRQEFALRYNGELFASKRHLKLRGRDAARLLWPGAEYHIRFPTGDPPDFREAAGDTTQRLVSGWLPMVVSYWLDREIEFEQTAFAALLDGPVTGQADRQGDEDVVVMLSFRLRNATEGSKRARLWIAISPQEEVEICEDRVVALGRVVPDVAVARQWRVDGYPEPRLRCTINTKGRGALVAAPVPSDGASSATSTGVAYDIDLDGGESHTVYVTVPFVTFTKERDWSRVAALSFDDKLQQVITYWTSYVDAGGSLQLPTRLLSDFHKAAMAHVAIAVDKDVGSGLYMVPAAAYTYGVCANEATWQIHMLDQAGHHDRTRDYLETFIRTQGTTRLDGDFQSADGAFLGLEVENGQPRISHFNYNLDHGTVMECLVDHYRYTGDRDWLRRISASLVAGCDMVTRERQATKCLDEDGYRVPEYGLMPAGHLEDNPEWRYWFSVNAHAYNGMRNAAAALAEIDHSEAARLAADADAYRGDIRAAARRAMVESPVVQLLDGTYVPHIPTRARLRGRAWGWIREAAYGAIHLLDANVFEPDEEEMTWLLKDLEDNLYVSREFGRPVDLARYWFSHGGITIQPGLTDQAINYLRRGQVKHGLRALFNFFGVALYPDVRAFTEHPVVELGHGVGPFYKTSDEAKSLVWLRAFLMREEGDVLHLAPGAPRAWFTPGESFGVERMASFFGPVSYAVQSARGAITWDVQLDPGRKPRKLVLHARRPDRASLGVVHVNGLRHGDVAADQETITVVDPASKLVVRASYPDEPAQ